ncbi:hypothetical protein ACFL20_07780 [Spirochaetota bacterium]
MRKKIIVDKKFQYKSVFFIMGIYLLILTVIIVALGIYLNNNNSKLVGATNKLDHSIIGLNSNIDMINNLDSIKNKNEFRKASKVISKNVNFNKKLIKTKLTVIYKIIEHNKILMLSIIIFVVIQNIILFFWFLKRTHYISGPVFVMNRHINDLLDGKDPEARPLRDKDEFSELYSSLIKLSVKHVELINKSKK